MHLCVACKIFVRHDHVLYGDGGRLTNHEVILGVTSHALTYLWQAFVSIIAQGCAIPGRHENTSVNNGRGREKGKGSSA